MSTSNAIAILLVEDEEFDVARVKNTLRFYSERVRIAEVVSNGRAVLDTPDANALTDNPLAPRTGGLLG